MEASDSSPEILSWLRTLPLAPEYHPSLSEFQDPISYILKIENEASQFGICKIVPPLPRPPKKTAVSNLNHSLSSRNPNPKRSPTFTTRQQQIGFCPRKQRPVKKPVWQSGESYTLQQFEAKAKHFEKTQLRKSGKKSLSALEIETLFWRACADKPFSVEYANDIPGSAFAPPKRKCRENGETLGETAWNMRGVSRGKGSLLRFMKEEIPGVTSPMVYVAMMFSWFAWHAEDHDLHSLNYLHFGAGKTWYGVPKDAAMAFEEVVRVYGYGGEVNPLATFAILGEKTTVMSPQVLIDAGIPCCRLVQNAGEFVVTFPRAYHSGFSHGFNCGEAANIATPEWLRVAKEAAVRRASINYPPLVSHLQLLYALALTLCSRVPTAISLEPRSSRLKGKKRVEGEMKVKQHFVQSVIQNNDLLHILREKGSSCILLPQNSSNISLSSNSRTALKYQRKVKPRLSLGLCSPEEAMEASEILLSDDIMPDRNPRLRNQSGLWSARGESVSLLCDGKRVSFGNTDLYTSTSLTNDRNTEEEFTFQGDGFLDQGLFSCVTCGILSFACVAVIQPREEAARYLMSVDCSFLNDQTVGIDLNCNREVDSYELDSLSGQVEDNYRLVDVPVQASDFQLQLISEKVRPAFDTINSKGLSALDLLASVYADSSDSEGEAIQPEIYRSPDKNGSLNRSFSPGLCSSSGFSFENTELPPNGPYHQNNVEVPISMDLSNLQGTYRTQTAVPMALSPSGKVVSKESVAPYCSHIQTRKLHRCDAKTGYSEMDTKDLFGKNNLTASEQSTVIPYMQGSHRDSSRMHIFCLEHAVEVERQLHTIGGVEMLLLCHPDYPKFEAQSKSLAEEMSINYCWKDIIFKEPSPGDEAKIRTALDDEAAIPGNGDWAVKLGINLYYSSTLSRSPLYSKQMPYNPIIYKVFGHDSRNNSPRNPKVYSRRHKKLKKLVVAGKWCGKVWMSNQVHPFLACGDAQEQESIQDSPNNSPTGPKVYSRRHKRQKKLVVAGKWCGKVWTSNQDLPYVPYGDASEHEPIKEYQVQSTDWKFNEEPEVEKSFPSVTRGLRKPGRKRMNQFESEEPKNLKRRQVDRHIMAVETSLEKPSSINERTFGRRSVRCETPEKITEQRISNLKDKINGGPSTRLRRRPLKAEVKVKSEVWSQIRNKTKKAPRGNKNNIKNDANLNDDEAEYQCNIEGCSMGFVTRHDLELHKRNRCPIKGCGKKFFSHKYLVQHRRVHLEDRPLKCPWKGCKMSFKWAWARTEHIRVHTGDRPYVCMEAGCGQTFRFVSDFSRHKRKTGHSVKKGRSR